MKNYNTGQICLFKSKKGTTKGVAINSYEEIGGANDGRKYIVIKELDSKKIRHIKESDVLPA